MKYNFKSLPNRKNTGSKKWELMYNLKKDIGEDVIPLSVADMEFELAPEIRDGLKSYLDDCVLGYSVSYPEYNKAVRNWFYRRNGFSIEDEWLVQTPGVVNGFSTAVKAFAGEGKGVIVMKPCYYPMSMVIKDHKSIEVNVPLLKENGKYLIDFENFEKACKDENNKVFLFCSPHNPTGRVWTREELEKIGKICLQNNVLVVSDEIWSDFILPGHKHTMMASLSEEIRDITITCTAPSKTFNLAGLATSNIIISNEKIRERFKEVLLEMKSVSVNTLGYKACEIAYNECESWLDELIEVIEDNGKYCMEFFENLGMEMTVPQGTYLAWVDFSSLGLNKEDLEKFLVEDAEFITSQGYVFGEEGSLYERINLGLPKEDLKKQLDRLKISIDRLKSKRDKTS